MAMSLIEQYYELRRLKELVDTDRENKSPYERAGIIDAYAKAVDDAFERIATINKEMDSYEQKIARRRKSHRFLPR